MSDPTIGNEKEAARQAARKLAEWLRTDGSHWFNHWSGNGDPKQGRGAIYAAFVTGFGRGVRAALGKVRDIAEDEP